MEESLFREAFKGLVAAGPVATILGVFCYVLWKQNQALITKLEKQHTRMLKLAVRVQRAVEVLAGIEHEETEVERTLSDDDDDDGEERKKKRRPSDDV